MANSNDGVDLNELAMRLKEYNKNKAKAKADKKARGQDIPGEEGVPKDSTSKLGDVDVVIDGGDGDLEELGKEIVKAVEESAGRFVPPRNIIK